MHQIQFYPKNAFGPSSSPFRYPRDAFCRLHRIDCAKPILVGEFPIGGLEDLKMLPGSSMGLEAAYESLWDGGYAGGFVWQASDFLAPDQSTALGPRGARGVAEAYARVRHHLGDRAFD